MNKVLEWYYALNRYSKSLDTELPMLVFERPSFQIFKISWYRVTNAGLRASFLPDIQNLLIQSYQCWSSSVLPSRYSKSLDTELPMLVFERPSFQIFKISWYRVTNAGLRASFLPDIQNLLIQSYQCWSSSVLPSRYSKSLDTELPMLVFERPSFQIFKISWYRVTNAGLRASFLPDIQNLLIQSYQCWSSSVLPSRYSKSLDTELPMLVFERPSFQIFKISWYRVTNAGLRASFLPDIQNLLIQSYQCWSSSVLPSRYSKSLDTELPMLVFERPSFQIFKISWYRVTNAGLRASFLPDIQNLLIQSYQCWSSSVLPSRYSKSLDTELPMLVFERPSFQIFKISWYRVTNAGLRASFLPDIQNLLIQSYQCWSSSVLPSRYSKSLDTELPMLVFERPSFQIFKISWYRVTNAGLRTSFLPDIQNLLIQSYQCWSSSVLPSRYSKSLDTELPMLVFERPSFQIFKISWYRVTNTGLRASFLPDIQNLLIQSYQCWSSSVLPSKYSKSLDTELPMLVFERPSFQIFKISLYRVTSAGLRASFLPKLFNSTIHKAADLMVRGHSMISTGTIPVEHKSVHWLSMGAAGRNHLWGVFQSVFFWECPVTKEPAALWIAL